MSTCSEPNVPILLQANFAPGSAGNDSKCAELPSAAPPTHSVMTPAMQPMPAPPAPGSVSCHEKHAAVAVLRTFGTQNDIFCAFSRQKRQEQTAAVSCYESPCRYPVTRMPKNFSKLGQTGQNKQFNTQSIPCRYPISQKFAATLRHNTTLLGQFWTDSAPISAHMRGFIAKETDATADFDPDFGVRRRSGPRRGSQIAQRAGSLLIRA